MSRRAATFGIVLLSWLGACRAPDQPILPVENPLGPIEESLLRPLEPFERVSFHIDLRAEHPPRELGLPEDLELDGSYEVEIPVAKASTGGGLFPAMEVASNHSHQVSSDHARKFLDPPAGGFVHAWVPFFPFPRIGEWGRGEESSPVRRWKGPLPASGGWIAGDLRNVTLWLDAQAALPAVLECQESAPFDSAQGRQDKRHRIEYRWEASALPGRCRLAEVRQTTTPGGPSAAITHFFKIEYATIDGHELPSRMTARTTAGWSFEFRYGDYRLDPKDARTDAQTPDTELLRSAENKIYQLFQRAKSLQFRLAIEATNPEPDLPTGVPRSVEAEFDVTVRFQREGFPNLRAQFQPLFLRPREPAMSVPPQLGQRMQMVAQETLRLFDPVWSLEDAYTKVVHAEKLDGQTKYLLAQGESAHDRPLALWVNAERRLSAIEVEGERGLERVVFRWKELPDSGELLLAGLQIETQDPTNPQMQFQGTYVSQWEIEYRETQGLLLPSTAMVRSTIPGGAAGQGASVKYRFSYQRIDR